MAALTGTDAPRLLRPLLGLGRARLRATLEARGQAWIEDPSNRDPRFARVRVRRALKVGDRDTVELAGAATRIGAIRAFDEAFTNQWLARHAVLHPAGYAWLDLEALRGAPRGLALRMLARTVCCIGGRDYPPRRKGLIRTLGALIGETRRAATLAGCLLTPMGRRVLVCRESRRTLPVLALRPGHSGLWDGRFAVEVTTTSEDKGSRAGLQVRALGRRGWEFMAAEGHFTQKSVIPGPARFVLPALWCGDRLLAVPHAGYQTVNGPNFLAIFRPIQPFVPPYFAVARARVGTI
jgi:tRNA(Ile)-lysidine synthase